MSLLVSKNFFHFVKNVFIRFKWYVAYQLFACIVWAFLYSYNPYLQKKLIDSIIGFFSGATANSDSVKFYFLLFACIFFCENIIYRLYELTILKTNTKIKKYLGDVLFEHITKLSHIFYQNNSSGDIAQHLQNIMVYTPRLTYTFIDAFFDPLFIVLVAAWSIAQIKSTIFLFLFLGWVSFFLFILIVQFSKMNRASEGASRVFSSCIGSLVDTIGNMFAVKVFSNFLHEIFLFQKLTKKVYDAEVKRDYLFLITSTITRTSFSLYLIACCYFLYHGIVDRTVTPGDCALIFILNTMVSRILWQLREKLLNFMKEVSIISDSLKVLAIEPCVKDALNAVDLKITHGKVEFKDVIFSYTNDESELFNNLSAVVAGGSKVGLVGYSGGGKTTFANLILRIFDIKKGLILIDEQDIKNVTEKSLRNSIATVTQDPLLFNRSVMDNIRYGNLDATDEEVFEAARKAHAHDFIMALPGKYESHVGERGSKLSGGQRQRIAIARAILKAAPILFLDEATSQLDSITEHVIQECMDDIMRNKTVFVIAHRLSTLQKMDRILVFDKGKIVQDGSHQELIAVDGLYKELWNKQQGIKII